MKKILSRWWPIFCIALLWGVFASPYFLKNQVPFPTKYLVTFFPPWNASYGMPVKNNAMPDVITQIYPWKKLTIESWKLGQVPLWNPYAFAGTAHAANYQTAVFSPFNLLFVWLPMIDAWSILVLLQPLLAGLFMYVFLRGLERSRTASLLGSIAFMFCGFLVTWMAYATLGYAAMWLPLLLFGIHRYFKKRQWWIGCIISFALALSFTSGHFQISLYVLGAGATYVLYTAVSRKVFRQAVEIAGFFLLGLGLAAPQLAISWSAYMESFRSGSFVKGEIIPWQYLPTLFSPDFYGNPVTRNDWFGHYAEWSGFVGVAPLLLGFYGGIFAKYKEKWFFILLGLFALFLALPTPLSDLLFALKIPVLSTSAASRIIILFSFAVASLSAFGLDQLREDWHRRSFRRVFLYGSGIVLILGFLWGWLFLFTPFSPDRVLIAKRNMYLPTALMLAVAAAMIIGMLKKKWVAAGLAVFVITVSAFDVYRFAAKWMPFDPKEYLYPPVASVEFLQKEIGQYRIFGNVGGELGNYFHIPLIEGYDALYQDRYGQFISSASDGTVGVPERSIVRFDKYGVFSEQIFNLLGVRYVLHRLSDGRQVWTYPVWQYPHYKQIHRDEHYEVYENTHALPRAFLASSYELHDNTKEILDRLYAQDFPMRDRLVLEQKPEMEPEAGKGEVMITRYTPNLIAFTVQSTVPKLLFLSDVYDEGWKAKIDGRPTPVLRADYDFRAVAVPAGKHDVVMEYRPREFISGMWAAGIALIIMLLLSGKKWYENRFL